MGKTENCDHDWHTAVCFGHCPSQYREGWEVFCRKCGQWGFQESVEISEGEFVSCGQPWEFDPKEPSEDWIP